MSANEDPRLVDLSQQPAERFSDWKTRLARHWGKTHPRIETVEQLYRKLQPVLDEQLTASIPLHGFTGAFRGAGRFPSLLTFFCTMDHDGQIEVSFSLPSRRPNNWDVKQAFEALGLSPMKEESKATGRLRHYIIQLGIAQ